MAGPSDCGAIERPAVVESQLSRFQLPRDLLGDRAADSCLAATSNWNTGWQAHNERGHPVITFTSDGVAVCVLKVGHTGLDESIVLAEGAALIATPGRPWKLGRHTDVYGRLFATWPGSASVARSSTCLVRFVLYGDSQSPSYWPLRRRMLRVLLYRKRFRALGNNLASTSPASIDSRMDRRFSGFIHLVELRADADLYVIAAPEQRHRRPPSAATLAQATRH